MKYNSSYIGKKFGRWTVLGFGGKRFGRRTFITECECGGKSVCDVMNIVTGKSLSCGCLPIEINTKHGLHKHPLYSVWEGMIARCYNKNNKKYHNYGGRGVTVCEEWKNDFKIFYDWAIGKWEKGLQIDKDILSPFALGVLYSPEMCTFVTAKQNTQKRTNTRVIEYNGVKKAVSEWADEYGISYQTFQSRLRYGWSIERILTEPINTYCHKRKAA